MGQLLPLVVRFDNITSCVVEIKQPTYLTKGSLEPMAIWLFIHCLCFLRIRPVVVMIVWQWDL